MTPKPEAQQTLSVLHRVLGFFVRNRVKTSSQITVFSWRSASVGQSESLLSGDCIPYWQNRAFG
jgi:hypothetical protein